MAVGKQLSIYTKYALPIYFYFFLQITKKTSTIFSMNSVLLDSQTQAPGMNFVRSWPLTQNFLVPKL